LVDGSTAGFLFLQHARHIAARRAIEGPRAHGVALR
jgi:hypothetical protein